MTVDRTSAMYERQPLPITNPQAFAAVKATIESAFSSGRVADFLKSLDRSRIRIRNWDAMLAAGKLGGNAAADYAKLSPGDQGQIREFYLENLEQVQPAVREKFFKVYSYF